MRKSIFMLLTLLLSSSVMASSIGLSSHPFVMEKHIVTTQFDSYLSNGSGMGIAARYLNRMNEKINMEAGFGVNDGDRASRFFAGADMMIIPDYGRQPRFSIKGLLQTESVEGERINSFGAAPTVSKGFSFWGNEAFPFLALPINVGLNTDEGTYETSTALATGITGRLPFGNFRDLVGNLEANFSLRNSYTSIVAGVSLPIQ
ncbi:MAG: hypothetical protein CME62_14145 [Halobacteriovoraceae bacterium]|nr:hypothetical protein [Halobacteriovoraceae bacterium]